MADNLFDIIQQNKNQVTGANAVPETNQTAQVQGLLQAKTGKAITPGTGQPVSNIGEQVANANTRLQLGQVGQQAQVQNQALQVQSAGVKQQEQQGITAASQARQGNDLQTRVQVEATLSDLERNKGEIRQKQDSAALESVASTLRIQNQEYVDNLQREGNLARLNDNLQFKDQLQSTILGDQKDALASALQDKNILDFNNQEFEKQMGQMSIDQAWDIYNSQVSAEKGRAGWEALGSVASAGSAMSGGKSSTSNTPTQTGAESTSDTGTASTTEATV